MFLREFINKINKFENHIQCSQCPTISLCLTASLQYPTKFLQKSNTHMCVYTSTKCGPYGLMAIGLFATKNFVLWTVLNVSLHSPTFRNWILGDSNAWMNLKLRNISVYTGVHSSAKNIQISNHIQYSECPTTPLCPSSSFQRLKKYTHTCTCAKWKFKLPSTPYITGASVIILQWWWSAHRLGRRQAVLFVNNMFVC